MIKYYDKYHLMGIATVTAIIIFLVSIWVPDIDISNRLGGTGAIFLLIAIAMFMHKFINEVFND